ncbi:hypothetical protein [Pseudogracilibacillus auburnensis]|uniref:hypothetical protein n=1 Tax=Pseudogracilibacillus auburnensis TaxID=1494959 RepID=UPI001A97C3A6|nr:hypothetical protein [Pseudogracilibacillus auburnensis]MBO1004847.1 hypothetical protein [Pseudogracilibacillus auburnensis]
MDNLQKMADIFERPFSTNCYDGILASQQPYNIELGSRNILISAPHSVNHLRNGQVKEADVYTGTIAKIIHTYTNAFCIYGTKIYDEDPNFTIGGQYKSAIQDLCNQYPIQMVIDLHGAAIHREFDIDLGTMHGQSIGPESVKKMRGIFMKNQLSDVRVNDTFPASTPGTITYFSKRELKIDAIQMEINCKYRNPKYDLQSFTLLIRSLVDIVNDFGKGNK